MSEITLQPLCSWLTLCTHISVHILHTVSLQISLGADKANQVIISFILMTFDEWIRGGIVRRN